MYTKELLKERITATAKGKGYTVKGMLLNLGLNENTVNQISDKKGISSFSLAMIADYLDCSVDYLLGRTDKPKPEAENIINTGDIMPIANGDNSISAGVIVGAKATEDVTELLRMIQDLPLVKRAEAIIYLNNLKKEGE